MTQFTVKRIGECKACGKCCPEHCMHLKDNKCLIQGHKSEWCEACGRNHEICDRSPTFPARHWRPECGYQFIIEGREIEIKGFYEVGGCESTYFRNELLREELKK